MIGIIGGSGFLGTALVSRLALRKHDVHCYDLVAPPGDVAFTIADVEELDRASGLEYSSTLINLAAVHRDDIKPLSRYFDVNVKGAEKVCAAATKHDVRQIIFTSSVAIYGFAAPNTDESGEPNPFNEYGRTKYLAEQVYFRWQQEQPEERSLVVVRPTVIFGPGNRGNVYNLLRQIADRRFLMVGTGVNVKSMAYVENVAAFLEESLAFGPGIHVFNYVDKPDLSVRELICTVREALFGKRSLGPRLPAGFGLLIGRAFDFLSLISRRSFSVSSIRMKKFMATTQFSSAVADIKFVPPYTLEEGLVKTIRYEFLENNRGKPTFDTE